MNPEPAWSMPNKEDIGNGDLFSRRENSTLAKRQEYQNNRQVAKKKEVLPIPNKMVYHERICLLSRRKHGLLLTCFINSNPYWHFTFDGPSKLVLI